MVRVVHVSNSHGCHRRQNANAGGATFVREIASSSSCTECTDEFREVWYPVCPAPPHVPIFSCHCVYREYRKHLPVRPSIRHLPVLAAGPVLAQDMISVFVVSTVIICTVYRKRSRPIFQSGLHDFFSVHRRVSVQVYLLLY